MRKESRQQRRASFVHSRRRALRGGRGGRTVSGSTSTAALVGMARNIVTMSKSGNPLRPCIQPRRVSALSADIPMLWMCFSHRGIQCSVITVHGIRGDFKVAWTDENSTWWVNNDLFKDLSTRQIDHLYEIDATSTIYELDGVV